MIEVFEKDPRMLRDMIPHMGDYERWASWFWGPPEFAKNIPLPTLASLGNELGRNADIIRSDSGGIIVIERLPEGANAVDRFVAKQIFDDILCRTLGS